MSTLTFDSLRIPGHRVGKSSWFPAIRELIHSEISAKLDEDDGLFIGYGMMADSLPYTLQDDYDSPEEQLTFRTAVLENDFIKAVFLPELGGRLWSLVDKVHHRELLLTNTRLLPCNLGIRNAWFAGGVEFNCGRRGHDEQTMSPRFTAVVDTPDYPVLRFYEYQRDRCTPFQYDCFLPDDAHFLYIRGRIWNPNDTVVPMYWWSNIALPEVHGSRIVVPADEAFANWYSGGSHALSKVPLPFGEGFDATYPENFRYVKDHFYNIPENHRRYECLFYPDGYGFCHLSTRRMRGRKLFVWGQSQGGRHWNKKLLGPELDGYIEVQGGLGRSQQECLPMPPKTAWEWLEAYGALQLPLEQLFGEWESAKGAALNAIDSACPETSLEELLRTTHDTLALKAGEVVVRGAGWGALEELRAGEKLSPHLDFGEVGPLQHPWVELLEHHRMTTEAPESYLVDDRWFELLKGATPSWQVHYHLALNYYRRNDLQRAEEELLACGDGSKNRHWLHLFANIRYRQKRIPEAREAIKAAGALDVNDASFIKEVLKMLLALGDYAGMTSLIKQLPPAVASLPLVRLMKAFGLAYSGQLDEAEAILLDASLDIPDIREGENSTSALYIYIQRERSRRAGRPIDESQLRVPYHLDLRMSP